MDTRKYADHFTDVLAELGYSHCFLLPGGATMHLVDAARQQMITVPFVHEVSAAIATEYFNEISEAGRAYSLVTAGPGITNAMTGIAGAYLESRDLLIVGGQVKSADLKSDGMRQRGIQEIDGVALVTPITKAAVRIEAPIADAEVVELVSLGLTDRRGPIFFEFCLDAQGAPVPRVTPQIAGFTAGASDEMVQAAPSAANVIIEELHRAQRPIMLIGGGVSHTTALEISDSLAAMNVPLMTTWNGFDRIADSHPMFVGRPNTWGQRSANILLSQADLVIGLGTRLGIQQTGFNWQEWTKARIVQVDVDRNELTKGHPRIDVAIQTDADSVLRLLSTTRFVRRDEWMTFCANVRELVPLLDSSNEHRPDYLSPFALVDQLSDLLSGDDILIPCSSGSGNFVPMEVFRVKLGQRVLTNKGLASMGYGLAAAIGAALAAPNKRTVLVEGDGSFSQNIQELGTVAVHQLNLKVLLLDNDGYASIRTTQRNYFGGAYVGCDTATGLGFPSWHLLAQAFGIPFMQLDAEGLASPRAQELLAAPGPAIFVAQVDPEQTYFPKVASQVQPDGSMMSNAISHMSPPLTDAVASQVFKFVSQSSSQ